MGTTTGAHVLGDAGSDSTRGVSAVARRVVAGEHVLGLRSVTVPTATSDRGVRSALVRHSTSFTVVPNVVLLLVGADGSCPP